MTIRTLIVDDEPVARRRIKRLLANVPQVAVVGECADGASAVDAIEAERPDLVFMDVQMPEVDGLTAVARLKGPRLPAIVFVTAYDAYALQAFEVHAVDYLLKPFSAERFRVALARARERLERHMVDAGLASLAAAIRDRPRYLTRVSVRHRGRILLIDLTTVDWLEAADNYVRLHIGRHEHLLRETLASLEKQLDPDRFVRIHRSAVVQIDRIAELHPASHGDLDVVLKDGTELTLSRTWRHKVSHLLGSA